MTPDDAIDPAPEPRPAVPRPAAPEPELAPPPKRRWHGPVGLVLNDAGLKLLALILAVMMWQLVRGRIEMTDTVENVVVEVRDLPPDLRILGGNRRQVSLTLSGPAGDVRRVKADLVRTASPLVFRLEDVPADLEHGDTGSVTNPKKFAYPVEGASDLVSQINPPLRFEWYRVKEVEVDVGDPELAPIPGRSDLQISPGSVQFEGSRKVRVTGPREVVDPLRAENAVLPPDPVDATRLVSDLDPTIAYGWESGFDAWRRRGELRLEDLVTIDPPRVKGTYRLRFVKTEPVENRLEVMPAFNTTWDDYADWAWEVAGTGGAYNPVSGTLKVGFQADERVIASLKKNPDAWVFGARLPPPPKEGERPPANERVPVLFLWCRQDPPPTLRLDSAPIVFITLKKKAS